ncbi:MAG: hemerythrin domain-containing protein [Endomicrobiales bacterium]|nr:hemerythrin domain-containing protein [Endomicrobiales bacterium]
MTSNKSIIEIIFNTHHVVSEKVIMLRAIVKRYSAENLLENTESILNFFNKILVEHFKKEDELIKVIRRDIKLTDIESKIISEISEEHTIFLKDFSRLTEIAGNLKPELKEDFIEICNNVTDKLTIHAEKEDNVIYRIGKEQLNRQQLDEIEDAISKIA